MAAPATVDDIQEGSLVYIAGPMSGYPNFNFGEFNRAAKMLWGKGHIPVNPADKFGGMQWLDHETYMRFSLAELIHCDVVYVLRGAEASEGATVEVMVAEALGLGIVRQTND